MNLVHRPSTDGGTSNKYNFVWGLKGGLKELLIPELGKMSKVSFMACIARENLGHCT